MKPFAFFLNIYFFKKTKIFHFINLASIRSVKESFFFRVDGHVEGSATESVLVGVL